ncbi:MAG: NAD(P)/FAD-dependent oxidoreductase [Myxococcota bacterium]
MNHNDAASGRRPLRIAVIGAGPGGLCTAVALDRAGFHDYTLYEKGAGVGGTWYHNRYPGCACDVASTLYSFSFAPKLDWTRPFGTQAEILAYMEGIAERYGILSRCRFEREATRLVWDERAAFWRIGFASGEEVEAEIVVSALGMFNELAWPSIPGRDAFAGVSFHSARWNWDHDLSGRRVGVIGSAASAVQFVPEIAKQAAHVSLFQRTANWVLPKDDAPYSAEEIRAHCADPSIFAKQREENYRFLDDLMTMSNPELMAKMAAEGEKALGVVQDPLVREKLRPRHPYGCKRPLLSNDYYPAFNRPNLELVTDTIERIEPEGVVTIDGRRRAFDTLIYATGFETTKYLSALDVRGRGGKRIDEAWNDGAIAYLGITTAGFPNLFMLYGPNTNNGSILEMIESQVDHVLAQVERIAREDLAWVDVRPDAMRRFNDELQRQIAGVSVWQASCNGYYRAPSGRIVTQWPGSMSGFKARARTLDREAFETGRARQTSTARR